MNNDGGKEGKIHHGGNPVLTPCCCGSDVAGNLAVHKGKSAASAVIRIEANWRPEGR
jgi:hypothetical protein